MVRDAGRGCPPRASPLADQTLRLGRLGGRPGTFDPVCRRVVLDIRGRVRIGVGVGGYFDGARPHARHKRAYESKQLSPGADPAKHDDSSVRAAFRPVNPVPTKGPAVDLVRSGRRGRRTRSRGSRSACDTRRCSRLQTDRARMRSPGGPCRWAERAVNPASSRSEAIDEGINETDRVVPVPPHSQSTSVGAEDTSSRERSSPDDRDPRCRILPNAVVTRRWLIDPASTPVDDFSHGLRSFAMTRSTKSDYLRRRPSRVSVSRV